MGNPGGRFRQQYPCAIMLTPSCLSDGVGHTDTPPEGGLEKGVWRTRTPGSPEQLLRTFIGGLRRGSSEDLAGPSSSSPCSALSSRCE